MPSASIDALVSRPPVNTPSARPPRSKSLISSPCSRMIWPISPWSGLARCRATSAIRNSREPPMAPIELCAALGDVEARGRELAEGLALLVGQPEQVADDQERDREGERRHQVDGVAPLPRGLDLVELALDDRLRCPGAVAASRRIVNSGVSSRRSLVCSGGSVKPRPPKSPSVSDPLVPM